MVKRDLAIADLLGRLVQLVLLVRVYLVLDVERIIGAVCLVGADLYLVIQDSHPAPCGAAQI